MKLIWILAGLAGVVLGWGACQSGSTTVRPDAGQPDSGAIYGEEGGDKQSVGPRWRVTADWPTGWPHDIVADGRWLYVVNIYGLMVYDRTEPAAPALVARHPTPGEARLLAIEGDLAVVSDGRRGVAILDLADPTTIAEIAVVPVSGEARGVALRDGILVAGSSRVAPQLLDVSDPESPVELGTLPGFASQAAFHGDRVLTFGPLRSDDDPPDLCTLDTRQMLRVLDVSDPTTPVEIGSIQFGNIGNDPACQGHLVVLPHAGWGLAVHKHLAYVVEGESRVRIVDLSNPAEPSQVGQLHVPASWIMGLSMDSGELLAHTSEGIQTFDLTDPLAPVYAGSFALPESHTPRELAAEGNRVAALSFGSFQGFYLLDTQNPYDLTLRGVLNTRQAYVAQVALHASRAYMVNHLGLTLIDLADPTAPRIEATREELGEMYTIALGDTRAMLAGDRRIAVLDLSEPGRSELLGDLELEGLGARHAAIGSDLGLIVSGSTSIVLRTVDLSDPTLPVIAGRLDLPGVAPQEPRVALSGNTAYVACGTGGLAMVDVHEPDDPKLVGTFEPWTREFVFDVAVQDNRAFVAAGPFVHVLDITDRENPVMVDEVDTPGHATRVIAVQDHVVVGDTYDLVVIAPAPGVDW